MASKKPTQPPAADMTALIARIDELSKKVLSKGFTSKLPLWKRWVGAESEYDVSGLRDVVNANALMLDDTNAHLVRVDDREFAHFNNLDNRVAALEGQPRPPFPVSG